MAKFNRQTAAILFVVAALVSSGFLTILIHKKTSVTDHSVVDVQPLNQHRGNAERDQKINVARKIATIKSDLLAAKEPSRLLLLAANLRELNGFRGDSIEVKLLQELNSFSPIELGELAYLIEHEDGFQFLRGTIVKKVPLYPSAYDVSDFLKSVKSEKNLSEDVLFELGESSDLLTPGKIQNTMAVLSEFDTAKIGAGLAARMRLKPDGECERMLREYFSVIEDPRITGPLTKLYVDSQLASRPQSAAEIADWLLSQDPKLVSGADEYSVKLLTSINSEIAINYVNHLLESDQIGRASKASLAFAKEYSKRSPQEAFQWALNLPSDFGDRRLAIGTTFSAIVRRDDKLAQRLLESSEPAIRKDLVVIRDATLRQMTKK